MKVSAPSTKVEMETLEKRELLSSAILGSSGLLTITGRLNQGDSLSATVLSNGTVSVGINGGIPAGSPFTGVKSIKISSLGGPDDILVDESQAPAPIFVQIYGGPGKDSIQTVGNEAAFLSGGGGADTIVAGNGNTVVHGGGGGDNITVGNGNNIVLGGSGANTISGGTGSDTLVGGDNGDVISGGGGDDLIWGVGGNDTLTGNIDDLSGEDKIYSGTGFANQINAGSNDKVNPGHRVHPKNATAFLANLESLKTVS